MSKCISVINISKVDAGLEQGEFHRDGNAMHRDLEGNRVVKYRKKVK